jgi:hypothetical protein
MQAVQLLNAVMRTRFGPVHVFLISLLMMGVGFFGSNYWANKSLATANTYPYLDLLEVHYDVPAVYAFDCDGWNNTASVQPCIHGPDEAQKTAVLFGDSVAVQWFSALADMYSVGGWRLVVLMKSGCPMVDIPIYYERIRSEYTVCEQWRNAAIARIAEIQPDLVLIGSAANYDYTLEEWEQGSRRIIQAVSEASKEVMVMRSTPSLPFDGTVCLARKTWQPKWLSSLYECSASPDIESDNAVWQSLNNAGKDLPNVKYLDLNPIACPNQLCVAWNGRMVVFVDNVHLTDTYVKSVSNKVAEVILSIP